MSSCLPCLKVCNVPVCSEEIIIGTIADVNTDTYIVVHNKTTGRKQYVSTQSDAGGIVTLVTSGLGLMPEHSYELAVIPRPGSPCDKYTITVGEFTGTCISVSFENAKDSEGCPVTFTSVELEVETDPQPATGCVCVTQAMVDGWDAAPLGLVVVIAKKLAVDCSTVATILFDWETGFNASNVLYVGTRIDYVSGTFDNSFNNDIVLDTAPAASIFAALPLNSNFGAGVRFSQVYTNVNNLQLTGDLQLNLTTPSGNPDCVADFYVYGIKIS